MEENNERVRFGDKEFISVSTEDHSKKQVRMVVLVGCECSQVVTKAFRLKGHEAYSCDILEARYREEWHIRKDIKEVIRTRRWDLIILHPPCTKLANSGNKWYSQGKEKYHERLEAIEWTLDLWNLAKMYSDRVALENPVGALLQTDLPRPQWIEPYYFGDNLRKKTGLWLHNLGPLISTCYGYPRSFVHKVGVKDRQYKRSLTPKGLARAMADQWG